MEACSEITTWIMNDGDTSFQLIGIWLFFNYYPKQVIYSIFRRTININPTKSWLESLGPLIRSILIQWPFRPKNRIHDDLSHRSDDGFRIVASFVIISPLSTFSNFSHSPYLDISRRLRAYYTRLSPFHVPLAVIKNVYPFRTCRMRGSFTGWRFSHPSASLKFESFQIDDLRNANFSPFKGFQIRFRTHSKRSLYRVPVWPLRLVWPERCNDPTAPTLCIF